MERYVDDTIAYVKIDAIEFVLSVLNSFHENIKFTYEIEQNGKIAFLDVLLIRKQKEIQTTVYRKPTHSDIYLHWDSFAPQSWKRGTLKTLLLRAYWICSDEYLLEKEIKHLKNVFIKVNGYPTWVVKQIIRTTQNEQSLITDNSTTTENNNEAEQKHMLILPYKGRDGDRAPKNINKEINKCLPENKKAQIVYTGTKLSSKFSIKDKTKKEHQHDLIYSVKCPDDTCNVSYNGEIGRRLAERVKDHSGRDKDSHMYKHSVEQEHPTVKLSDFTILSQGYKLRKFKRKISEALFIKENRPSLNKQEKSVPLKLFN